MLQSCPRCEATMAEQTYRGVTISQCTNCKGFWFDRGELERYMSAPLPAILDEVVSVEMAVDSGGRYLELDAGFSCPYCNEPLHECTFSSDRSLTIATCNGCYGTFIDEDHLPRLRKLAPVIQRAKQRDIERPLSTSPESLKRTLNEASDAERQEIVKNAVLQFERASRGPFGCALMIAAVLVALTIFACTV